MIILKSILAGIAAVVLYLLFPVVIFFLSVAIAQIAPTVSTGSGGIGAVAIGLNGYVAIACFAIGFIWQLRRGRRRALRVTNPESR